MKDVKSGFGFGGSCLGGRVLDKFRVGREVGGRVFLSSERFFC